MGTAAEKELAERVFKEPDFTPPEAAIFASPDDVTRERTRSA